MLVAWKYKKRDTVIQRMDPRARWILLLSLTFSIIQFWDIRILLIFFVISFGLYFLCKLTWAETRRIWTFVLILVVVIIGINALLTGRGGPGEVLRGTRHTIWQVEWVVPWVGWVAALAENPVLDSEGDWRAERINAQANGCRGPQEDLNKNQPNENCGHEDQEVLNPFPHLARSS